MISREVTPITPEYMTGVDALLKTLIRGDDTPNFRITAFTYDNESAQYGVAWSQDSGLYPALDDTGLNAEAHRLPLIKDGQRAILVETWIDHTPVTGDGIPGVQEFENFMVAISASSIPLSTKSPSARSTICNLVTRRSVSASHKIAQPNPTKIIKSGNAGGSTNAR